MTSGAQRADAGDRILLVWVLFMFVLLFIPMNSKSGHFLNQSFAGLFIEWSENDDTYSPNAHTAQGEALLKAVLQIPVPPDFDLIAIPGKDKTVSHWASSIISAEEKLKVFYALKPGITLPFTSQMQLLEAFKTCWKQRIFSALFSLCLQLFLYQHWLCQHQWGGEAVQKAEC